MTERLKHSARATSGSAGAVSMLQRRCACGTHTIAGTQCDRCAQESSTARASEWVASQRSDSFTDPRFTEDFSAVRTGTDTSESQERYTALEPAQNQDDNRQSEEELGAQGMCVIDEQIPRNRSGLINGGGQVGERFDVAIRWGADSLPAPRGIGMSSCRCRCGEYRQWVKGHLIINGLKEDLHLFGGKLLDENDYREDGRDTAPQKRYGHRDEPQTMDEEYLPDRANGCTYIGRDFPRVMIGSHTDMLFRFKGQTFDRCSNTYGQPHEWEVRYVGPINR